jgi:hypothetical protein
MEWASPHPAIAVGGDDAGAHVIECAVAEEETEHQPRGVRDDRRTRRSTAATANTTAAIIGIGPSSVAGLQLAKRGPQDRRLDPKTVGTA